MVVVGGDELSERGPGGLIPGPWCVVYRGDTWRMSPQDVAPPTAKDDMGVRDKVFFIHVQGQPEEGSPLLVPGELERAPSMGPAGVQGSGLLLQQQVWVLGGGLQEAGHGGQRGVYLQEGHGTGRVIPGR